MYALKQKTKQNIETLLLLNFSDIVEMDYDDELHLLKPVDGDTIKFPTKRDNRKFSRGNPLLTRRRFKTIEEVNRKLTEISNAGSEF